MILNLFAGFRRAKISENQVTEGGEDNLILEKKMNEFWKIIIEKKRS